MRLNKQFSLAAVSTEIGAKMKLGTKFSALNISQNFPLKCHGILDNIVESFLGNFYNFTKIHQKSHIFWGKNDIFLIKIIKKIFHINELT